MNLHERITDYLQKFWNTGEYPKWMTTEKTGCIVKNPSKRNYTDCMRRREREEDAGCQWRMW